MNPAQAEPSPDGKPRHQIPIKPSDHDLDSRLRAFIDERLEVEEALAFDETAQLFYFQNREYLEPFGVQAIIHVVKDRLKELLLAKHPATKQLEIPEMLNQYPLHSFVDFKNKGRLQAIPLNRARWEHFVGHQKLLHVKKEEIIVETDGFDQFIVLASPYMSIDPSMTFEQFCEQLKTKKKN